MGEPEPFRVLNPLGRSCCFLVCDHASNRIPEDRSNLGLSEADLQTHSAWDIGAARVTEHLSAFLDAPALLANYSRLLIDVNRRLDHPTAIVTESDGGAIPGNRDLSTEDRRWRSKAFYEPYHEKAAAMVGSFSARGVVPAVIAIHSFTRLFYQCVRPWEIGFLWWRDSRLAKPAIAAFQKKGFTVGDNAPYDARMLNGTTLNRHADAQGFPNVTVEIRNDLLTADEGCREWAQRLAGCFSAILQDDRVFTRCEEPMPFCDPEKEERYFDELIEKAKRGEC